MGNRTMIPEKIQLNQRSPIQWKEKGFTIEWKRNASDSLLKIQNDLFCLGVCVWIKCFYSLSVVIIGISISLKLRVRFFFSWFHSFNSNVTIHYTNKQPAKAEKYAFLNKFTYFYCYYSYYYQLLSPQPQQRTKAHKKIKIYVLNVIACAKSNVNFISFVCFRILLTLRFFTLFSVVTKTTSKQQFIAMNFVTERDNGNKNK